MLELLTQVSNCRDSGDTNQRQRIFRPCLYNHRTSLPIEQW